MTICTIPNRPKPSENRDINAILADFDAITKVINGELEGKNNLANEGVEEKNYKKESIPEEKLAKAVKEALAKTVTGLTVAFRSVNLTAAAGEMVQAGGNITVTSPAAGTQNQVFGVAANGHTVTLKTGTAFCSPTIPGETSTEVKIAGEQSVVFITDGSVWYVIGGALRDEHKYSSSAELEIVNPSKLLKVTLSTVLAAFMTVRLSGESLLIAEIGGIVVGEVKGPKQSMSFRVPANQEVTVTTEPAAHAKGVFYSYILCAS